MRNVSLRLFVALRHHQQQQLLQLIVDKMAELKYNDGIPKVDLGRGYSAGTYCLDAQAQAFSETIGAI